MQYIYSEQVVRKKGRKKGRKEGKKIKAFSSFLVKVYNLKYSPTPEEEVEEEEEEEGPVIFFPLKSKHVSHADTFSLLTLCVSLSLSLL